MIIGGGHRIASVRKPGLLAERSSRESSPGAQRWKSRMSTTSSARNGCSNPGRCRVHGPASRPEHESVLLRFVGGHHPVRLDTTRAHRGTEGQRCHLCRLFCVRFCKMMWELIIDGAMDGVSNMAIDAALLEEVERSAAQHDRAVLRLERPRSLWAATRKSTKPSMSVTAERHGIDIVHRPDRRARRPS